MKSSRNISGCSADSTLGCIKANGAKANSVPSSVAAAFFSAPVQRKYFFASAVIAIDPWTACLLIYQLSVNSTFAEQKELLLLLLLLLPLLLLSADAPGSCSVSTVSDQGGVRPVHNHCCWCSTRVVARSRTDAAALNAAALDAAARKHIWCEKVRSGFLAAVRTHHTRF